MDYTEFVNSLQKFRLAWQNGSEAYRQIAVIWMYHIWVWFEVVAITVQYAKKVTEKHCLKSITQWLLLREMWRIKKQLWKSENSSRNSEEKPAIILSANLSPFVSVFKIKFFCNWVKARSSPDWRSKAILKS